MSKTFKTDLTGQKFNYLTVIEFYPTEKGESRWRCKCDCGNEAIVIGKHLISGHTKSCGCYVVKKSTEKATKHGQCGTRLYRIWGCMKGRCYYECSKYYYNYGGRGIKICDEWLNSFQAFYDWAVANGYKDDLSIDRIDNNGNYEPSNCRWATREEQNANKRGTRIKR